MMGYVIALAFVCGLHRAQEVGCVCDVWGVKTDLFADLFAASVSILTQVILCCIRYMHIKVYCSWSIHVHVCPNIIISDAMDFTVELWRSDNFF